MARKKLVVILDTNTFVSGLISPKGKNADILRLVREGRFEVITSRSQIVEIKDVLSRPHLLKFLPELAKGTPPRELLSFFKAYTEKVRTINPPKLPWDFQDLKDHYLLDLAMYSKADFLVTGDKLLQSVVMVGRCTIVSPVELLAFLASLN